MYMFLLLSYNAADASYCIELKGASSIPEQVAAVKNVNIYIHKSISIVNRNLQFSNFYNLDI